MGDVKIDDPGVKLIMSLLPSKTIKQGYVFRLPAGEYIVTKPMVIPEGYSLTGVGVMIFDSDGFPVGFDKPNLQPHRPQPPKTVLRADPNLVGDMLTLRDGAHIAGLRIEDQPGRSGNLVVISSRKPGDSVAAVVEECELINPNPSGADLETGPTGRAVLVITRNLNRGAVPAPDEGSIISLTLRRSRIRSRAGGTGVFATNFAARSQVTLRLRDNVIGGGLDAQGGVSRTDTVADSTTLIISEHNRYRADWIPAKGIGWSLHGGTNPPPLLFAVPGVTTNDNQLVMDSSNDQIVGFAVGVHAAAAWCPYAVTGRTSRNRLRLGLSNILFECTVADVELFGAKSGLPPAAGGPAPASFRAGDNNSLVVTAQSGTASGVRANVYADTYLIGGTLAAKDRGTGNRLRIGGVTPFNPPPPAAFKL